MSHTSRLLTLWRQTSVQPGGKKVFARLICLDAPYFASIQPVVEVLQPGHVEVSMRKRHAVTDHNGSVHAMAMCVLAELTGRLLAEVSLPSGQRWQSRGITAEYLHSATSDLTALANTPLRVDAATAAERVIPVEVRDTNSTLVGRVQLTVSIAPCDHGSPREQGPSPRLHNGIFQV